MGILWMACWVTTTTVRERKDLRTSLGVAVVGPQSSLRGPYQVSGTKYWMKYVNKFVLCTYTQMQHHIATQQQQYNNLFCTTPIRSVWKKKINGRSTSKEKQKGINP